MTKRFNPCKGKTACHENDTHCMTCGRSLEEIYRTRGLIDDLAKFILDMDYINIDNFMEYLSSKAARKVQFLQKQRNDAAVMKYEHH